MLLTSFITKPLIQVLLLILVFQVSNVATQISKPNILFILIDDLGFNDVSYHGSVQTKTPHIDKLAQYGTVLHRHYTQPVCSPSRGALMTSKYAINIGLQDGVIEGAVPAGVSLDERFMPEYFKDIGYDTHAVGKWHVGYFQEPYLPTRRGFDTFLGMYESGIDYYMHTRETEGFWGLDMHWDMGCNYSEPMWDLYGDYATDLFTQHARIMIEMRDQSKPFFLYLSHRGVHSPTQGKTSLIHRFHGVYNDTRRDYLTQVAAVDDSVGSMVAVLEQEGIHDDTIIVVASDNGGQICPLCGQSNYPLRGAKRNNFEGGVRTPAIVSGPGIPSGKLYSDYFHITDWLPTLLEGAGGNPENLPDDIDGMSQWSEMTSEDFGGRRGPRDEVLVNIYEEYGESAIIVGDYKLHHVTSGMLDGSPYDWSYSVGPLNETDRDRIYVRNGWKLPVVECNVPQNYSECTFQDGEEGVCLFNIQEDPCEYNNLAPTHPEIVTQLMARLEHFNCTMVPSIIKPPDVRANPALRGNVWGPWE